MRPLALRERRARRPIPATVAAGWLLVVGPLVSSFGAAMLAGDDPGFAVRGIVSVGAGTGAAGGAALLASGLAMLLASVGLWRGRRHALPLACVLLGLLLGLGVWAVARGRLEPGVALDGVLLAALARPSVRRWYGHAASPAQVL